jgi:signal transduction histidine kinase/CheY-like chemotaxis protein/HPt (histidine-containing phosphotransfer) domain-containing protein
MAVPRKPRFRFLFESLLALFLVLVIAAVLSTGYMAYKSLIGYADAVKQSADPEMRLVLIKSISGDLSAAEGNIKSFNLSKDPGYLRDYNRSKRLLSFRLDNLDRMIDGNVRQAELLDSIRMLAAAKIAYLDGFIGLQYRNLVTNELDSISAQIEKSKREVVILNTTKKTEKKTFFRKMFRKKSLRREQQETEQKKLESQIKLMEEVKNEVAKVKMRQDHKLTSIDKDELELTSRNREISEQIADHIMSMEVIEILSARQNVRDLEARHNRSNTLITFFSITAAVLLLVIGFVVVSFLLKRRKYEIALVAAKNEAEHYAQMQETFLANMSHEIRTPMNAIAGFTEQVLQTPLEQQQRSYLDIVQRSVRHLLVVINDILDYSRLKADKLTVEHIPYSLQQVIGESVLLMSEMAAQKRLRLADDTTGYKLPSVMGDPVRMKQVLLNLLGNAIKFTDAGEVRVGISIREKTASKVTVQVSITDTGIGIPEEDIARIFDAFEQAEASTTRRYGGSGLGLSITRRLVSLMNGTIRLESGEGKGTAAILEFTFEQAPPATQHAVGAVVKADHPSLAGKEVLVADDEEWNTSLLATILTKYNAHFTIVKNGREAVEHIASHHTDLVLMDVRMPELNGFEATRMIRELPLPNAPVPVIALTAATGQQQVDDCHAAGMNAVLGKPYTEQELLDTVAAVLLHGTAPVRQSPGNPPQQDAGTLYSLAQLEIMSNGDRQFFLKMLRIFIDTAAEALEKIREAIAAGDALAIQDYAHKLAPPCRHLEAVSLLALLKQMEAGAKAGDLSGMPGLHALACGQYAAIAEDMKKLLDS